MFEKRSAKWWWTKLGSSCGSKHVWTVIGWSFRRIFLDLYNIYIYAYKRSCLQDKWRCLLHFVAANIYFNPVHSSCHSCFLLTFCHRSPQDQIWHPELSQWINDSSDEVMLGWRWATFLVTSFTPVAHVKAWLGATWCFFICAHATLKMQCLQRHGSESEGVEWRGSVGFDMMAGVKQIL